MPHPCQKFLLPTLTALLMACAPPPARSGDKALLIGINKYQYATKSLHGTHNDVAAFRGLLTQRLGFKDEDIKELHDGDATHDGILSAIDDWLVQGSQPGDRVVLYYSGHGDQTPDRDGDETDDQQDEALVAYDAAEGGKNMVLDDEIHAKLNKLAGREVLAVFDSCHSGTVTRDAFGDRATADAKTPDWERADAAATRGPSLQHQKEGGFIEGGGNIVAFFAVSPNQKALETARASPNPHGVFTAAFVEGANLKADANKDGQVAYAELLDYVQARSKEYCESNGCALGLTPDKDYDEAKAGLDFLSFGRAKPATPVQAVEAILPHGNAAGLSLSIEPGKRFKLGDPISYLFSTQRAGKLVIFDIDASGKMTQLFPAVLPPGHIPAACRNSLAMADRVPAGQALRIPDDCMGIRFRAREPAGPGKVVAVLIEDESIDTRKLIATAQDGFKSIFVENPQGERWMAELRARLDQVFHAADGTNRAAQWSVLAVDYAITP
jgi:hypothetical protein